MDFKVGENVVLESINNRRSIYGDQIQQGSVTKIGSKYITVETKNAELKFDKRTLRNITRYSSDYILFHNEQELLDARETEELWRYIRKSFEYASKLNLTLEQLRQIASVINEAET
jgi:hypothetical protein